MFGRNGRNGKNGHVGFDTLSNIHWLYSKAQRRLEKDIGCSICIPDCGKCCELNSITVKGVEGAYICDWLRRQKPSFRNAILDKCEEWLLDPEIPSKESDDREMGLGVYKGIGTSAMSRDEIDQAVAETWYLSRSRCPMLTEDKRCLIHPVRPLQCRAFGVTRIVSSDVCPRPQGRGEPDDARKYIEDSTVDKIRENIEKLKAESEGVYIAHSLFVATSLFSELRSQRFLEYVYHGKIPSAKMGHFSGHLLLWQGQLDEQFERESEIRMLVNPSVF